MNKNDFEIFDEYLSGTLDNEKIREFDARLSEDDKLKNDFEAYKETNNFLNNEFLNRKNKEDFVSTILAEDKRFFEKEKGGILKFPKNRSLVMGIAASVLLLVGFFFSRNQNPTYKDFVIYETISLTMRSTNNELLSKAEEAFNSKEFRESIVYFNLLLVNNPSNNELLLYKAVALLETGKYKEADIIFEELYNGYSVFKNRALWWASLSKLKQHNIESCIKLLKMVPEGADDFKLANKLLKKLE